MNRPTWTRAGATIMVLMAGAALLGAACGGGTSSGDKTKTAVANAPAPTTAATKAATAATSPTVAAATTPAASGTTSAAGGGIKTGTTTLGVVLTDANGKTLYTFDNDTTANKSSCNGGCATTWPPATATSSTAPTVSGATGTFTVITRDDGTMQYAYSGKPLYRFAADAAAGDVKGDGVGGIWHAAKP